MSHLHLMVNSVSCFLLLLSEVHPCWFMSAIIFNMDRFNCFQQCSTMFCSTGLELWDPANSHTALRVCVTVQLAASTINPFLTDEVDSR